MKEVIEYLKERVSEMSKSLSPMDYAVVIDGAEAQKIIDFYERHKSESEPPNAPDITPEWDKIDSCYSWVAIDESGFEFSHRGEPKMDDGSWWSSNCEFQQTGRKFDMTNIDWTKTLSKRPAK